MTRHTLPSVLSLLLLLLVLLVGGCTKPEAGLDPDQPQEGDWVRIEIPFVTPTNTTRAVTLTDEDENDFKKATTQVLVFDSNYELYEYSAEVLDVVPNNQNSHKTGKLIVKAKASSEQQTFVVIAGVTPKSDLTGLKSNILKDYIFTPTDQYTTGWSPATLPMWGEVPVTTITDKGASYVQQTLYLLRAVAAVDVMPEEDQPIKRKSDGKTLSITSVRLYNTMDRGYYAPAIPNGHTSFDEFQVTETTIPAAAKKSDRPMEATGLTNGSTHQLYCPETANGTGLAAAQRPCAVVGLTDPSGKETYYRIDFLARKDNVYKYIPLLRNHRYSITVSEVFGPGYDDPKEASKAPSTLLEYSIAEWDDFTIESHYDGIFTLYLRERNLHISAAEQDVTIHVRSNWTRGWHYGDPTVDGAVPGEKVISFEYKYPNQTIGVEGPATFKVHANPSTKPRIIKLPILAARLATYVTIYQEGTL